MTLLQISILFLCLLALGFGAWIYHVIHRRLRRQKMHRTIKQGQDGEKIAEKFLLKNGFEILESQSHIKQSYFCDDEEINFRVKADYLVEKEGRFAVVEVKTGKSAKVPLTRETRRQILEYQTLYDVDDIYLFNADLKQLHYLEFPREEVPNLVNQWSLISLVVAFVSGALTCFLVLHFLSDS